MAEKRPNKKVVVKQVKVPVEDVKKSCPIREYIEERMEKLQHLSDEAINPLDRLDYESRMDELMNIQHYMLDKAVHNVLGDIQDLFKDCDKEPEGNA